MKEKDETYKKFTVKEKLEKVELILRKGSERGRLKEEAHRTGFSIQISERGGNGPPPMGGDQWGGTNSQRGGNGA